MVITVYYEMCNFSHPGILVFLACDMSDVEIVRNLEGGSGMLSVLHGHPLENTTPVSVERDAELNMGLSFPTVSRVDLRSFTS